MKKNKISILIGEFTFRKKTVTPFVKIFLMMLFCLNLITNKSKGQGNIELHNFTNCDVYFNLYAVCDANCSSSNLGATTLLPANSSLSMASGSYTLTPTPTCGNPQWWYAVIIVSCSTVGGTGVVPLYVGDTNVICTPPPFTFTGVIDEQLDCNPLCRKQQTVPQNGNIVVTWDMAQGWPRITII